jgi:Pyruvate/2-oxoacid:ferredoxin oxidoreductase gamma subunit
MLILGFIQHASGLITRNDLIEVVSDFVPEEYLNLNLRAIDAGIEFAKEINFIMEK